MPLQSTVVLDLTTVETSTLASAGAAIASVQMCLTAGRRVIAVVGANAEREQSDLNAANRLSPVATPGERAAEVVAGAIAAAEDFERLLKECGLDAQIADVALLPATRGHALDAEPRRVSGSGYSEALAESGILVVPGGVGRDEENGLTSLGARTGPLSALFIAERLALPIERPDAIPAAGEPSLGARKAERFAERFGIHAEPNMLAQPADRPLAAPAHIALFGESPAAGLILAWLSDVFNGVTVEPFDANSVSAAELINRRPDAVIDVSTDAAPVYEIASWALRSGRPFVTSNAALLAERGGGLSISALIGSGTLLASGAVAGCPELASVLQRVSDWPGVARVQGTFSPAGDRILDLRARGMSQEDAVRIAADELGLNQQEIDETLLGQDAFRTLGAIAPLAFGTPATVRAGPRGPAHVSDADIARAASQGRRYRVIATTERIGESVAIRVGPVPLRDDDPLINDRSGAVESLVQTRDGITHRVSGNLHQPGSVAAAVLADLLQTRRVPSPARHAATSHARSVLGITA
ncbi:MAG: hypothetical protein AAGA55_07815 [Planctomycetota bacterium]